MTNAFNLEFSQEQLADLYNRVDSETRRAYDAVAEGMFQASRAFARSLSPVYDDEGNLLEEDTPEWELWAEELDNLVWLENFQIEGFDAVAYRKQQLEARLAITN